MADGSGGRISTERVGSVLVARLDGGRHGLFDRALAVELAALVGRVEDDAGVGAVVLTGAHRQRFISHADIRWLQEGGAQTPRVGRAVASAVVSVASRVGRAGPAAAAGRRTALRGAVELDQFHETFLQMNSSGVVYVAAVNGSALGAGAELAWACDARVMADGGEFFIGQPEVLLGFNPGGGGTQRLTRLVGTHRALLAMLDGGPWTPAQAHEFGAVDVLAKQEHVVASAVALADNLGSRPRGAVAAIKRSVYFGGSMPLADGLHLERSEFLSVLGREEPQAIMKSYMHDTEVLGELPLYDGDLYRGALARGRLSDEHAGAYRPGI